jgi:hypothetical protein
MARLVRAIHVFLKAHAAKTWMTRMKRVMTIKGNIAKATTGLPASSKFKGGPGNDIYFLKRMK